MSPQLSFGFRASLALSALVLSGLGLAQAPAPTAQTRAAVDDSPPAESLDQVFPAPVLKCAADAKGRREVRARHIVIEPTKLADGRRATLEEWQAASKKAASVLAKLESGADFSQLEHQHSKGAVARGLPGGDLGFFRRGVMVPQIERVAFCISVNQLSPIVRSDFGFHIIQVTGVR